MKKRRIKAFTYKLIPFFVVSILFTVIIFKSVSLLMLQRNLYKSPISLNFKNILNEKPGTKTLEALLKSKNISYSKVSLEGETYKIELINDEEILFDSKKPLNAQMSSLQLLLSRFTIEGKRFEKLDFRYDKPIIVFK